MSIRYKAIITIPISDEEVLEAENLFPNASSGEAVRLLMEQIYTEQTGKSYEEDGSFLEVMEIQ